MNEQDALAERFGEHREHVTAVAYRMLGSLSEAEDAVQETWLRLSRGRGAGIDNLGGWLTTVVGRVCLDMLRSRGPRPGNSPAAPGDVSGTPLPYRTPIERRSAASSTRSWPPHATATSPTCCPYSTPRWCCAPTTATRSPA